MIKGEGEAFELVRFDGTEDEVLAAWLAARRAGVGGSDVAAIMGLSKYRAPYSVWAEKSGLAAPADIGGKPAVHWGSVLEGVVGEEYARNHPDRAVRRVNALARSLSRPWAQASLDYEVRDPELGWGVLEIKTAGWRAADDWADGVPIRYQTQVVHYMSVLGRPFADVAVLIAGSDYREYRIMRDEADVRAVDDAVDGFWAMVESGAPPEITGADGDGLAVFGMHSASGGRDLADMAETPEALGRWLSARADAAAARERERLAANQLKQLIGDGYGLALEPGRLVWVRTEAESVDYRRLAEDHPGLIERYRQVKPRDMGLRFYERKDC